ncbi:MAG: hypothetical protein JWO95_983 [Verrucomicrobiales bacterium]|nr:hypothetical protein [Verrucomicrobiales bacterium]
MNKIFCIGLAVVTLLTACSRTNPNDIERLKGTWKPVTAELGGKQLPATVLNSISLKLDSNRYEVIADGSPDRGDYSLDAATDPKGMTITGTEGPNKGKSFPCIYEIQGDTLRICYDLSGAKRPAEFKSAPQTKIFLVTYGRKRE